MNILFFSPFSGIWVQSLVENGLASALREKGQSVITIKCDRIFHDQCIVMTSFGVGYQDSNYAHNQICATCTKRSELLRNVNQETDQLGKFVSDKDRLNRDKLIQNVNIDNWHDFTIDSIAIGRIAAYEFFITHKLNKLEIPTILWDEYKANLSNCILTYYAAKKIISFYSPERVIVYNSLYSVNRVFTQVAEEMSIPSYTIHAGANIAKRLETLNIFKETKDIFKASTTDLWKLFSKGNKAKINLDDVFDHFQAIREGNSAFTYSKGKSLLTDSQVLSILNLTHEKPIFVATLSSQDEEFAAGMVGGLPNVPDSESMFDNQFSWISWLIENFKRNPHRQLIIRVHPREFPNKREYVLAQNVSTLQELFGNLPENISVNWPVDNLSIYDIMQVTDAALNWKSTIGTEFIALGFPVIIPRGSGLFSYPKELNIIATDEFEFNDILNAKLELEIEKYIGIWKWLAFQTQILSVPVKSPQNIDFAKWRPKNLGTKLRVWNLITKIFIMLFPTILEKLSLKSWEFNSSSADKINRVLEENHVSLAEVQLDSISLWNSSHESDLEKDLFILVRNTREEISMYQGQNSKILINLDRILKILHPANSSKKSW